MHWPEELTDPCSWYCQVATSGGCQHEPAAVLHGRGAGRAAAVAGALAWAWPDAAAGPAEGRVRMQLRDLDLQPGADVKLEIRAVDGAGNAGPAATATSTSADLVDSVLSAGTKSGYTFTYTQDTTNTPSTGYTVQGEPQTRGTTGQRGFFTDQSGVIRYTLTGVAPTATSSPLQ